MTPKLKAKDLYDKFYNEVGFIDPQSKAKLCALIAVNELINVSSNEFITLGNGMPDLEYWVEVKKELLKL